MGQASRSAVIVGLRVDFVADDSIVAMVQEWVRERRRPPAVIVQTNAWSCVTGLDDPEYRRIVENADLSVADGMPLVWMARLRGWRDARRVYGPDLMLRLAAAALRDRWRIYLYGGGPGVAEDLAHSLRERSPGLEVVGHHAPPYRDLTAEEDEADCRRINAARPDIVWVALGGPKQDRWAVTHRSRLDASIVHGVGAAFDFLTGRVSQAPLWMRSSGLEWAYRLAQEPKRLWRRYLVGNARFLAHAIPEVLGRRPAGGGDA